MAAENREERVIRETQPEPSVSPVSQPLDPAFPASSERDNLLLLSLTYIPSMRSVKATAAILRACDTRKLLTLPPLAERWFHATIPTVGPSWISRPSDDNQDEAARLPHQKSETKFPNVTPNRQARPPPTILRMATNPPPP